MNIKVENKTALQVAAHEGHQRIVTLLLDAGADAKIQDEDGDNVYHYAAIGFVSRLFITPSRLRRLDRRWMH